MSLRNGFKRLKQSRGHAVHSPFAYELITQVFRSHHSFYAFSDIPERLRGHGLDTRLITSFNHLSYRLVHYFKARNILEVNPGTGINTLFLMAPSTQTNCTWLEGKTSGDPDESILPLLPRRPHRVVALSALREERWVFGDDPFVFGRELVGPRGEKVAPEEGLFDAIFVNCSNTYLPSIDQLLELGCERAFWVIHPITKAPGKQYWKQIVNDKRIHVMFEGKETGTVFPWDTLTPSRYFI